MKKQKQPSPLSRLIVYAGKYKALLFSGLFLSAVAMILGMAPYVCIWLVIKDLIAAAPDWTQATEIGKYGWMAFAFAVGGILVYFAALMCTHLAAFHTASNIRKQGVAHLMKTPLGFFDNNASGLLRNRLDGAASETETLLAHNLADIVGTAAMFIAMLVLMFVFDWRMGAACLLAAIISVVAMFSMMGGKNAKLMMEYQTAQDVMSKAGTEYVRGIPVVKVFQQTVYSFKAFKQAIEDYSAKAERYTDGVCRVPLYRGRVRVPDSRRALFSAVCIKLRQLCGIHHQLCLLRCILGNHFDRFGKNYVRSQRYHARQYCAQPHRHGDERVMNAPVLEIAKDPQKPNGNRVEFKNVGFTYEDADFPALDGVSFVAQSGQTIALVGPSGGGKTTAASLIPRFWDVSSGAVEVGGVDVKQIDPHVLMDNIAFVFQNNRLFKTSIFENVRAAKPDATREEVLLALEAAQCMDIIEKLPEGMDTVIGSEGTYLSGGEQQRIALARAILKNAPIVVLDEATAFADPENEVLIQKAFAELTKGKTVIMIAHRLSTVVGADKIIVLDNGIVVEEGTHEELKNNGGLYAHMWSEYNQAAKWKIQSEVR